MSRAAGLVAFLAIMSSAGPAWAMGRSPLYVSANGSDAGNCRAHACASIGYALGQASPGARVLVGSGTYRESAGGANLIPARLAGLTLAARGAEAVIDATGEPNGIVDEANDTTISGFTVENAQLEGILVEPPPSSWPATAAAPPANLHGVTVADNVVERNDRAYDTTAPNPFAACPSSPTDSDDCGEGVHLLGTSYSRVMHNRVADNVGGILVSDGGLPTATGGPTSVGPAARDLIAFNTSAGNAFDCGITLPSHDPRAVGADGQPQPELAGVHDNLVVHNVSKDNGGAGLREATPYPGTGAYDNTFIGNYVTGNGEGGFQLHSHAPQQDVNGNRVIANYFGTNNTAGDADSGDMATTAIILFSAVVPVTDTLVAGNVIAHNTYGVWKTANVQVNGLQSNRFFDVGTDVFTR